MPVQKARRSPRFPGSFQAIFLSYGLLLLNWKPDWSHYGISILAACCFNTSENPFKEKMDAASGFQTIGVQCADQCNESLSPPSEPTIPSPVCWLQQLPSGPNTSFAGKHIFNSSAWNCHYDLDCPGCLAEPGPGEVPRSSFSP